MEWIIYDLIGYGSLALVATGWMWIDKRRHKKKEVIGAHIANVWGNSFLVKPGVDPVLLEKEEAERLKRIQ